MAGDESGVSEVVGYLLVFGILSVLMVLSMVAFGIAQGLARERAIELEAESAAARVAGVIVQTALVAEQEGESVSLNFDIDLPDQLEGADYEIHLDAACETVATCTNPPSCSDPTGQDDACCDPVEDPAANLPNCTYPARVRVVVSSLDVAVESPVFAASAPTNVKICTTDVGGGEIAVRYDLKTVAVAASGPCLPDVTTTKVIFLGET